MASLYGENGKETEPTLFFNSIDLRSMPVNPL